MKIGIITHHKVHNHGAQLQLYALNKVFTNLKNKCYVLDYTKNYDFYDQQLVYKYNISAKSIPYYFKYMINKGLGRTLFNIKKKAILDNFRKENSLVGPYYSNSEFLDCVFIGSDEVFSIETGLTPALWGIGVPCGHKFSYAGSFGPTSYEFIKSHYACEYIKAGIQQLDRISVRDKNSMSIIERLSNKQVTLVCDPVLLYGFKAEIAACDLKCDEPYVLVYAYDNNMNRKEEIDAIVTYAKKNQLKIYSVGFYHKWVDKNLNVSPLELLEYFINAKKIITDTFHGAILSLITNKNFAVFLRDNSNKLEFLLSQYNLKNQIIENWEDLPDILGNDIDYNFVYKSICKQRRYSLEFIRECLKMVEVENE